MRILHSAALLSPPPGIINQMHWEQIAAHHLRINWDVRMFCPADSVEKSEIVVFSKKKSYSKKSRILKLCAWFHLRIKYHRWLRSNMNYYDVFILRHYVHDPFQLFFILHSTKPVLLVHHTLEVPELAMPGGMPDKARAFLEDLLGKHSIRKSSGIIALTSEIKEYELNRVIDKNKKCMLYPNGIIFNEKTSLDRRSGTPEILFVAGTFAKWHGLDLLLNEMKRFQDNFVLHLVGNLSAVDASKAEHDQRIVIHGRKSSQEIEIITETCWIGLSSFALHRKNMKEACTLKVREYLMIGLPVCAGYDDVFPRDFPYYSNTGMDLKKILNFAHKYKSVPRKVVSEAARPFIDKTILLDNLFQEISKFDSL